MDAGPDRRILVSPMLVESGSSIGLTVPRWAVFPIDSNTKTGLFGKSRIKTRQEMIITEKGGTGVCPSWIWPGC